MRFLCQLFSGSSRDMLLLLQLSFFLVAVTATSTTTTPSRQGALDSILNQRLSEEVVPIFYNLTFEFEDEFLETNKFNGETFIAIKVRNLSTYDSSFLLHAKGLTIKRIDMFNKTNDDIQVLFSQPNPKTDMILVTPWADLLDGEYGLRIQYSGPIGNKMVGIYKSVYKNTHEREKHVVATNFKYTHARKAFPCFDEPRFKAQLLQLNITYPEGYRVWANQANISVKSVKNSSLQMITNPSPYPMPTYLVAFIIEEFNHSMYFEPYNREYNGIRLYFGSKSDVHDGSLITAKEVTPQVLWYMENFTGFPNFAPGAMNQVVLVAIPDHAHIANANWGLLTFRGSVLLWRESVSTNRDLQNMVTVLSHALSNQWFGAYVTIIRWSDLFLSEGFGTYFGYHAADRIYPDWKLPKQFVIEQVHSALEDDSFDNSLPLSNKTDNADYSSRTNDVSYNKGASILRMVQHFLGIDTFQDGIKNYIRQNGAGSVTPNSLWTAFNISKLPKAQQPPQDLEKIMDFWITKRGYPILQTARNEYGDVLILQRESCCDMLCVAFNKWYVPVTYSTNGVGNTITKAWLTPVKPLVLPGQLAESLVVFNNQRVGFYRVDYDGDLLEKIQNSLNDNISSIDELDRAAIIDDQMAFARTWKTTTVFTRANYTYKNLFKFLSFLKKDDSYFSWSAALHGFNYILSHTVNQDIRNYIVSFIKEHQDALDKVVSFEVEKPEDQLYTLRQVLVLTWKCQVEDEDCLRNARDRFEKHKECVKDLNSQPSKNLRYIVYCNALRHSNNVEKDFDLLWKEYEGTKIETKQVLFLKALGCVSDTSYSIDLLNRTLQENLIRPENAKYVFASVYSNGPQGVTNTINFVIENYIDIIEHFDVNFVGSLLSSVAKRATTKAHVQTLTEFAEENLSDPTIKGFAKQAALDAAHNLEEIKRNEGYFEGLLKPPSESHKGNRYSGCSLSIVVIAGLYVMFLLF